MKSGFKLYEIDTMLRDAVDAAEAFVNLDTGEIRDDWAKFLDDVQLERDKKALQVAAMVREFAAESEAIAAERKRLQARERAVVNKAASLKAYLTAFVKQGEKIRDERVSISWSHRASVDVTDVTKIPDRLCVIERRPMLSEIVNALKAGEDVAGARIVDNQFIVIR